MTDAASSTLSGWGRLVVPGKELLTENLETATRGATLSRGLGRSYGDSSLPAAASHKVIGTRLADRILTWDTSSRRLRAEAGLSLAELNRLSLPRGLFTPVTPGTKFVTLGGMVASDVHGKNHHREGCFGEHVTALRMRLASDDVIECSPVYEPELFWATVGGMGLTGHILEVELTLHEVPSPFIYCESVRVDSIDEFLTALSEAAPKWPMTVGWIDCLHRGAQLGRGILMAGRWAKPSEAPQGMPPEPRKKTLPIDLPNWALNDFTAATFNALYYWKHIKRRRVDLMSPETFFYPLDAIARWDRAYGKRGFTQYQCVLPRRAGNAAVQAFMQLLTKLGGASPLCVIKDCGPQGNGTLSFPLEGTSIAVDMAMTQDTQRIVDTLNEMVIEAGGRVYLTKDRLTRPEHFAAMEPRLPRFLEQRQKWDPERRLKSLQSVRLFGDDA